LPEIEIWNLDLTEAVEPDVTLGGEIAQNSKKKKAKKFSNTSKKYKEGSHTDSVLSLSLNPTHSNILASGSVDSTVKIWDLNSAKSVHTCDHHQNRVNKVQWNPKDPTVILSTS
jgi:periodic tryptophan protein 1